MRHVHSTPAKEQTCQVTGRRLTHAFAVKLQLTCTLASICSYTRLLSFPSTIYTTTLTCRDRNADVQNKIYVLRDCGDTPSSTIVHTAVIFGSAVNNEPDGGGIEQWTFIYTCSSLVHGELGRTFAFPSATKAFKLHTQHTWMPSLKNWDSGLACNDLI